MTDKLLKMIKKNENNLKKLIRLAGLSHAEVAEKMGIAPESLSRHASGKSQFSIQNARDYAEILDIDPSMLLFDNPKIRVYGTVVDANEVTMKDNSDPDQWITTLFRYPPWVGVMLDRRQNYNTFLDGALQMIDVRPIQQQTVPQIAFGKNCIVKTSENKILQRTIYPSHDGKYTLVSVNGSVESDINLKFACPVLSRVERPELLGFEISS